MFKPIEFFLKDKKVPIDQETLKSEWSKLDDRDLLRYIKKAESAYDKYVEENKNKIANIQPFGYFLQKSEAKILFDSYGLPEKLPCNSKLYFFQKLIKEAKEQKKDTSGDDDIIILEDVKKEAEEKWSKLTQEDKNLLLKEFYELSREYNEKYFNFARSLPKQRVTDYSTYVNPALKEQKQASRISEDKVKKELRYKFSPFEFFYEKHQKEFLNQYKSTFMAKTKAKAAYSALIDKKKVKFVKKAEERFDQYQFEEHQEIKPLFSSLLSRVELKLLLESYGMPTIEANTTTGYFFKQHYKDFKDNHMKNVMSLWTGLSDEEKAKVAIEQSEKFNNYKLKNQKFIEALPLNRMEDYRAYMQLTTKKGKQANGKESAKSNGKLKKLKNELVDAASGMSDSEVDLDHTLNGVVDEQTLDIDSNELIEKFLNENSRKPENAFSLFVNEDLEKSNLSDDLDEEESKQLLNKTARKWYKLDSSEKESYEDKFKTIKKSIKKSIKNFIKEHSELNLNADEIKTKLNEYLTKNTRKISVHFEDDTNDVLNLYDTNLNELIDSDVDELYVKKEKKNKNKNHPDLNTPTKKIKIEQNIKS